MVIFSVGNECCSSISTPLVWLLIFLSLSRSKWLTLNKTKLQRMRFSDWSLFFYKYIYIYISNYYHVLSSSCLFSSSLSCTCWIYTQCVRRWLWLLIFRLIPLFFFYLLFSFRHFCVIRFHPNLFCSSVCQT